jgi:hypothetical protein
MLSVPRNTTRRRSRFVVPIDTRASAKRRSVTASKVLERDRSDCAWSGFTEIWLSRINIEALVSDGPMRAQVFTFPDRSLTMRPDDTPLINDRMVLQ